MAPTIVNTQADDGTRLDTRFTPLGRHPMNPSDPPVLLPPQTCHDCGASISTIDPLGGGLCEACLWRELSQPPEEGTSPFRDLVPGYEILDELGRGGMGVVYRARQLSPSREVALKMLLPFHSGQPELQARFQQEARTLADLEHPAILPLYEVGKGEGQPYFTMKLAVGGTLAQRLASESPWSARRAAELTAVLADALQYAHVRGVIHRDLKPGNVLFDEAGRPYLADFGLAKLEDSRVTYSRSAGVLGTPAYLAPEIAASGARAATTASDLYSLGAIFFELLTGRPPFTVEGLAALLVKIAEEAPPTPTSLNAQVPRDLEIVCLKCLRKSPADRYPTAASFAEDLRRWIRGEPVQARQFTPAERLVKWARRRPALAGLSTALAVTAIGSAVWLTRSNHQLNLALARAGTAQSQAEASLRRAEAAQSRAAQRAEFFVGKIVDPLEDLGRLDILNEAYADVLRTEIGSDEATRSRRVLILTHWGRSLFLQNRYAEAQEPLAEAVALAASLPPTPDFHALHADASAAFAILTAETGTFESAVALLDTAEARLKETLDLPAVAREEALAELAAAYTEIGLTTVRSSKEIQQQAARAVSHRRQALSLSPSNDTRLALAVSLRQEGESLVREARSIRPDRASEAPPIWEAALPLFEEALTLARDLTRQSPVAPAWEREEAQNLGWLAEVRRKLDPAAGDQALELLKQEKQLLARVVGKDTRNWRSQRELASSLDHLASLYQQRGETALEDATRVEHEAVIQNIHHLAPAARSWMLVGMNADLELGYWHLSRTRPEKAESYFQRAWKTAETLVNMRPTHRYDQRGLKDVSEKIRLAWAKSGHPDREKQVLEQALAYTRHQADTGPAPQEFQWIAAHYHRRLADWAQQHHDLPAALEQNLLALEKRADVLRAWATPAQVEPDTMPTTYLRAEHTYIALDRIPEAVELARQALDFRREIAQRPLNPNPWAEAVEAAAVKGIEAGGDTEVQARRLAARALEDLYPRDEISAVPVLAPYVPKPDEAAQFNAQAAAHVATLKALAGLEPTTAP